MIKEDTAERCVIEFEQLFNDGWKWVYTGTFTLDDAEQAGLLHRWDSSLKKRVLKTGTWAKWTKDMLFNRCSSRSCRRIGSHKLGGARYTPEELSSGNIEDIDSVTPETLLATAPAPEPEKKRTRQRKSTKVQEETHAEIKDDDSEVEELTGQAEEEANKAFDAMANKESEAVNPETGEIKEEKKAAKETKKAAKATKEEPPAKTEEPEPECPPGPDNFTETVRAAHLAFKMQPDVVYKALNVTGSVEMERKYKPAEAWEKIWKYHLAKLKEGK